MNALQRNWDARAAANFILGGAGAGLILCSVLIGKPAALMLGLVLIAAGLGAVWLEIGRKLRAAHVFFNPLTSWMSRESFAAVMVFSLGIAFLLFQKELLSYGTALAALAFLWCQARILRAAKGIPAWRAPQIVPLTMFTGIAEGAGLGLFFSSQDSVLALFALAVLARALAWGRYGAAVKSVALEPAGKALVWIGTVVPLALALWGDFFSFTASLAGLAALCAGWWLKFALVTRASFNQGFSLPHLPVRGTR